MAFETGYVREAGDAYNPTAVRWWIFADDENGFFFARGGREPTARSARSELAAARLQLTVEREAWQKRKTHELVGGRVVRRFTHELLEDGSLHPLPPPDLGGDE